MKINNALYLIDDVFDLYKSFCLILCVNLEWVVDVTLIYEIFEVDFEMLCCLTSLVFWI